jgi:hypothetical protein
VAYLRVALPGGLEASVRQLHSQRRINLDGPRRRKVEHDQQVTGGDQGEAMLNRSPPRSVPTSDHDRLNHSERSHRPAAPPLVRGQHEVDRQVEQRTEPSEGCPSSALRASCGRADVCFWPLSDAAAPRPRRVRQRCVAPRPREVRFPRHRDGTKRRPSALSRDRGTRAAA